MNRLKFHLKPVQIMVASLLMTVGHVSTAASTSGQLNHTDIVQTNAVQTNTISQNPITPSIYTSIDSSPALPSADSDIDSDAIRQDLVAIITSDDYATAKEVESWEPMLKPRDNDKEDLGWLEKLLRFLLDNQSDSESTIAIVSMLLKVLLVAALIAFIIWVARRAGYLEGWAQRIKSLSPRRSTVESMESSPIAQGWEQIPSHERLPSVANQYLDKGDITAAASLIYRGSLRWLVMMQQLDIAPATTEMRCLTQIQQLNHLDPQHDFIIRVIHLWIETAYDERRRETGTESLESQLRHVVSLWSQKLPILAGSSDLSPGTLTPEVTIKSAGTK